MNDPAKFREQLNTVFRVDHNAGAVPLVLAEVTDSRVSGGFEHFSLFFHGPSDRILAQGTYAMQHDALGTLDLFIVPVMGSNAERIIYQAHFSLPASASAAP